jgi:hypothetical protein
MDNPKANQLLAAASKGDMAKIQQLMASGAPIEAADVNRMTPVMLAAQGGHFEAFRMLVEAGANLHALAFRQVDLLEMAARGGNVQIVRFLLDKGLRVDGHWQPRVEALRKIGHETPLIEAATSGHVDVVRVLLEAGADKNAKHEGKSALQKVKELLRDPIDPGQKQPYHEVAALLGEVSVESKPPEDTAAQELEKFAANAQQLTYAQIRKRLTELCRGGRAWQPVPDHGIAAAEVVAFTLRQCKQQKTLDELQEETRDHGYHLVLAEPWAPGDDAALVLFPTSEKFAVVTAVGTEGANYGIQTADVIAWLRELDQENPFALRYCGHDLVGGAFLGPVKTAKKLAERMAELCPSVLDECFETPGKLARALSKSRTFLLRWD